MNAQSLNYDNYDGIAGVDEVAIPKSTTVGTFKDTDAGKNLTVCEDAEEMFDQLGI